jgi:hypothetical protein
MRKILVIVAVMYSAAAVAQSNPPAANPPMVGDKPLVQVQPKGTATAAKSKGEKPKSMAQKLQACLEIDDGTKERLNCYDAVIAPKPKAKQNAKAGAQKSVTECSGVKEEDERLTCFNGFVEKLPKLPS